MKTKKLTLNKVTVANLGRNEMSEALGGDPTTAILSYLTVCTKCNGNEERYNLVIDKTPTKKCTR